MSTASTDRAILLGTFALQLGFVNRDELLAAVVAWSSDKLRPFEEVLIERTGIQAAASELLAQFLEQRLAVTAGGGGKPDPFGPLDAQLRQQLMEAVSPDLASTQVMGQKESTDLTPPPHGAASHSPATGRLGDRFRVLRPHAQGGLGAVSVAIDEELNREVALKEIQPQYVNHSATRARFMQEAEITGRLQHPGIVPVYGLGRGADGQPFYAMRFIRGESLQEALQQFHSSAASPSHADSALGLRQLLNRFVDACNAIEYAHSQGVLHRDIKPGNIMLGDYGETLVVDWGLAKVIAGQHTEDAAEPLRGSPRPAATQAGSAVGTPAYMSPEQAAGRVDELGFQSDIYSLGATLYTILTGVPPVSRDSGDVLTQVARGEFLAPRKRSPHIPRALEAICLRAMALHVDDRYASAHALADDIERWLADEPVAAYTDRPIERSARWLRKHRSWAAAGVVSLLLITAVSTAAATLINGARHDAEEQRDVALAARENADRLHGIAAETLDEVVNLAYELRRHQPLLRRATNYYQRLLAETNSVTANDPLAVAKRQRDMALLYLAQNDLVAAEESSQQAIDLLEQVAASDSVRLELSSVYGNVGGVYQLMLRPEKALEAYDRAIELQQPMIDEAGPIQRREYGRFHFNRGLIKTLIGTAGAEQDLRAAVGLFEKVLEEDPNLTELKSDLAAAQEALGQELARQAVIARAERDPGAAGKLFEEAEQWTAEAIGLFQEVLDTAPTHSEYRKNLANALADMGTLCGQRIQLQRARESYEQAQEILARLLSEFPLDPDFREKLATVQYSLGLVADRVGDSKEAQVAYQAAVDLQLPLIAEFPLNTRHRLLAIQAWTNLGGLQMRAGQFDQAASSLLSAIDEVNAAWKSSQEHDALRTLQFQVYYSFTQFAIHAGKHADLVNVAAGRAELEPDDAQHLFAAASLYALAIPLVKKDAALSESERETLADRYASGAVDLLRRSIELGCPRSELLAADDLKHLHDREDFQSLAENSSETE